MIAEFRFERKKGVLPAIAGVFFVGAAVYGFASQTGYVLILYGVLGAVGLIAALASARVMFDRRVQLSLGPEGLFYRLVSADVVPWSDITRIARVRSFGTTRKNYRPAPFRTPSMDTIAFDVGEGARLRGGSRTYHASARVMDAQRKAVSASLPAYVIYPYGLEGTSTDALVDIIKTYWKGEVEERETGYAPTD